MPSVKLELQGAVVGRLKADPAVAALVNGRIYDSVPSNAVFPYVSYGPGTYVRDDAGCINGFQAFVQLDVWSRAVGKPEADRIADAVERALHDQDAAMPLPSNALASFQHVQTDIALDPDGLTTHGVLRFEGFIEQMPPPNP